MKAETGETEFIQGKLRDTLPDFRTYLEEELRRRKARNPYYSLRAFSRCLQIQSSFLSKILRRQRRVTPEFIERVAPLLRLDTSAFIYFQERARKRPTLPPTELRFQMLSMDVFAVISHWYHYAILELASVRGFRSEALWIAKQLDIPTILAEGAVERLVRLGMLTREEGTLRCAGNFSNALDPATTGRAQRQLQAEVLNMALGALASVPESERDQSSLTFACSSLLLPELKERLRDFRREWAGHVAKHVSAADRVYHLSVSLYPVSARPAAITEAL